MTVPARACRGCSGELPPKHLRTQLAPPDSRWHEVRTHGLSCLLDFLEREEEALDSGRAGEVAWSPTVEGRPGASP